MIKKFLKNYRDKNLFLIRKQIYELVDENSRVVDLGCGNGKLLRILSSKISYGLGIDKNKKEIRFAKQLTENKKIKNLEFKVADASENLDEKFDYSILMFVLHSLDYNSQEKILDNAKRNSGKIIIIDYDIPIKNKLLVYLDELIAGHYGKFKDYLKRGGIEELIKKDSFKKFNTSKKYIKIWEVKQKV